MELLINIDDFRGLTGLSMNVNQSDVEPFIRTAQQGYLKPLVCDALYNELLSENPNFSVNNEALMEYIKPFLVFTSYAKYIPASSLLSTRTGFVKQSGENATGADSDELKTLISEAWANARNFERQLKGFLKENYQTYPLWYNSTCYCEDSKIGFGISKVGKGLGKYKRVYASDIGRPPE